MWARRALNSQKRRFPARAVELVAVPVGLAVEVHGLVGAAEHNGKQGAIASRVGAGLGRMVALHPRSSASYQIH